MKYKVGDTIELKYKTGYRAEPQVFTIKGIHPDGKAYVSVYNSTGGPRESYALDFEPTQYEYIKVLNKEKVKISDMF